MHIELRRFVRKGDIQINTDRAKAALQLLHIYCCLAKSLFTPCLKG